MNKVFINHAFCRGDSGEKNNWKCSKCKRGDIASESTLCPGCFQCINPNKWDSMTDPSHIVLAFEALMNKSKEDPTSDSPSPNKFILDFCSEARNRSKTEERFSPLAQTSDYSNYGAVPALSSQLSTEVLPLAELDQSSYGYRTLSGSSSLNDFAEKNKGNTLAFCKLNPAQQVEKIQEIEISFDIAKKVLDWSVADVRAKVAVRKFTIEPEFINFVKIKENHVKLRELISLGWHQLWYIIIHSDSYETFTVNVSTLPTSLVEESNKILQDIGIDVKTLPVTNETTEVKLPLLGKNGEGWYTDYARLLACLRAFKKFIKNARKNLTNKLRNLCKKLIKRVERDNNNVSHKISKSADQPEIQNNEDRNKMSQIERNQNLHMTKSPSKINGSSNSNGILNGGSNSREDLISVSSDHSSRACLLQHSEPTITNDPIDYDVTIGRWVRKSIKTKVKLIELKNERDPSNIVTVRCSENPYGIVPLLESIKLSLAMNKERSLNLKAIALMVPSELADKVVNRKENLTANEEKQEETKKNWVSKDSQETPNAHKFAKQFLSDIKKATFVISVINFCYPGGDMRQIVVMKHAERSASKRANDFEEAIKKGTENCSAVFQKERHSTIAGGVHAMPEKALPYFMEEIGIAENDQVWDFGVGYPRLAFVLSAFTNKNVYGSEIKMVYERLEEIQTVHSKTVKEEGKDSKVKTFNKLRKQVSENTSPNSDSEGLDDDLSSSGRKASSNNTGLRKGKKFGQKMMDMEEDTDDLELRLPLHSSPRTIISSRRKDTEIDSAKFDFQKYNSFSNLSSDTDVKRSSVLTEERSLKVQGKRDRDVFEDDVQDEKCRLPKRQLSDLLSHDNSNSNKENRLNASTTTLLASQTKEQFPSFNFSFMSSDQFPTIRKKNGSSLANTTPAASQTKERSLNFSNNDLFTQ